MGSQLLPDRLDSFIATASSKVGAIADDILPIIAQLEDIVIKHAFQQKSEKDYSRMKAKASLHAVARQQVDDRWEAELKRRKNLEEKIDITIKEFRALSKEKKKDKRPRPIARAPTQPGVPKLPTALPKYKIEGGVKVLLSAEYIEDSDEEAWGTPKPVSHAGSRVGTPATDAMEEEDDEEEEEEEDQSMDDGDDEDE